MKVAVTFENGNIFQHFGHSEEFKIYEIEDGNVISSEVIKSEGEGHGELAVFLKDKGVSAVICGGIGGGATLALESGGIEVFPGIDGDADEAVTRYINGEIEQSGANCDHHDSNGGCGDHESHNGGCGGGCGNCGGGCGGSYVPTFDGPNIGKTLRVHYKGTLDDGTQFDSSYDRGEPLEFTCGVGMMIEGFDEAVADMNVGDVKEVHLETEQAYGRPDPHAIITFELDKMPGSEELNIGDKVILTNPMGQQFPVTVTAKSDERITFDGNHEMAGKSLNFVIELIEIVE